MFSEAHVNFIANLIKRPDVRSVSFNYDDLAVWRLLANEQMQRANATGLHPQIAFGLSCPDSGLSFNAADLGAYVHVPFEGAADADLFVQPPWRAHFPHLARDGGGLYMAFGKPSYFVFLKGIGGEIAASEKTHVDGWTLYRSLQPYSPLSPFLCQSFDTDGALPDTGPSRQAVED